MSDIGGDELPPVVQRIIADPSGYLAGWEVAASGAEASAAQIDAATASISDGLDAAAADGAGAMDGLAGSADAAAGSMDGAAGSADGLAGSLDAASGSADGASASLDGTAASADGAAASADDAGTSFSGMQGVIGLAAGAMVVASVDMASSWQDAVTQIANSTNVPVESAVKISNALQSVADGSKFTAAQVVEAYAPVSGQFLLLEGHALSAAQAQDVMRASMHLAEATGESLGTSTQALSSVMIAYGLSTSQAASTSDILWNTSKLTGTSIDQLATGIDRLHGRLGPIAPNLSDVSTAVVLLAQHGIQGNRGIMQFSTAMTSLLDPTKTGAAEIQSLGLHVTDAHGNFVGLASIIEQLTPKLDKMNQKQREDAEAALFGKGAIGAMNDIIEGGLPAWDRANALVSQHGTAAQAAANVEKDFGDQVAKAWAQIKQYGAELGEKLIPIIEKVVGWFEKHRVAAYVLAGIIGGVLVGAIGAAVAVFVGFVGTAGLVAAAIGGIVGGLIYAYQHSEAFRTAVGDVGRALADAWHWLDQFGTLLWDHRWGDAAKMVGDLGEHIWSGIQKGLSKIPPFLGGLLSNVTSWAGKMFDSGMSWVERTADALPGKLADILGSVLGWLTAQAVMLVSKAPEIMDSYLEWIVQTAISLPGKLFDLTTHILSAVEQIPGDIWNILSGLPGDLVQLGESMIQGLISGIEGEAGNLFNVVGNIASSAWHSFASAIGFGSPATEYIKLGESMGQGVVVGVEHTMPKSMAQWIPQIPTVGAGGSSTAAGVAGQGQTSSTQPITLNLTMQFPNLVSADARQLSNAALDMIAQGLRTRDRALSSGTRPGMVV